MQEGKGRKKKKKKGFLPTAERKKERKILKIPKDVQKRENK